MGLFTEILCWILVIGILIFIFAPGAFSYFIGGLDEVEGKLKSSFEDDSSVKSCLSQVNEQIKRDTEMAPIKVRAYIKEYKKFNNTKEALEYKASWGSGDFLFNSFGLGRASDWLEVRNFCSFGCNGFKDKQYVEQEDIILGLIRAETYSEGQNIRAHSSFLCIDGEYKTEPMCSQGTKTGINLTKHNDFSYELYSGLNNLDSYNLTLLDMEGNILDYVGGTNPSGGILDVELEDDSIKRGMTYLEFTTPCGTHRQ